jgi:hypothetical protein
VYALIQSFGALIAAGIFRVTHPDEFVDDSLAFSKQVDEKQDFEMEEKITEKPVDVQIEGAVVGPNDNV